MGGGIMHIAIVGCGQLSRMLALAGIPLGLRFSFIADEPMQDTRCVQQLGKVVHWEPGQAPEDFYNALGRPTVVTAEKEQIDVALLHSLQPFCDVHPSSASFTVLQDRSKEKLLLADLGISFTPYIHARSAVEAIEKLSLPLIAKSCRNGYDGKNQKILRDLQDAIAFDDKEDIQNHIIEQWVPFEREVSVISVRDRSGNICHYPLTENVHESGILKYSIAPARQVSAIAARTARDSIARIMESTDYVGVMAMECFLTEGQLLVNEIAPRVHNSGHWTQSGCKTSQFENHLRAIAGLPLGSTENHSIAGMVNLIGTGVPSEVACSSNSTLHWYNKTERPGRKVGHVNFSGSNHEDLLRTMNAFKRDVLETRPDS